MTALTLKKSLTDLRNALYNAKEVQLARDVEKELHMMYANEIDMFSIKSTIHITVKQEP